MSGTSRGHNADPSAIKRRWRTPPDLFAATNERYGFTLDAAAEDGASLCRSGITPEMDCLVVPWALYCPGNARGERWAWLNCPWGPPQNQCLPGCHKQRCEERGHHIAETFVGTQAFTRRALSQAATLTGVVLLLPSAPDTRWWREVFAAASEVRLLPRVAFIDPDTGRAANAPPGCGVTLFEVRAYRAVERRVLLADALGRGA